MVLYVMLAIAVIVSISRPLSTGTVNERTALVNLFLIGIAIQCIHLLEEYLTGFHRLLPPRVGLDPLSDQYFVTLNIVWIAVWLLAAVGLTWRYRIVECLIWFFALMMCFNGLAHPVLAVWAGGYFPGLVSSPLAGIAGVLLLMRLLRLSSTGAESRS